MNRRDLLVECVNADTPVDVLTAAWCSRCGNPECVRSTVGLSKFEQRIKDWEEKLFLHPPTLAPEDPRFSQIVAQKFITIDVERMPEIRSDWTDPRDLKEPEIVLPPAKVQPDPLIVLPPTVEAPPPSPPKPSTSGPSPALNLVGANASDQSGKVLRGGERASTSKSDPWATPEPPDPPDPADIVVQPGAKIKMGSSSGV